MPPTAVALLLATAAALVPRPASAAIVSTAADVCAPTANPCTVSTDLKVASGATLDFGSRALVIARGASLDASPGGMFTINAGSLTVQPGGQLLARSATGGYGGDITVNTSGDIAVQISGTANGRIDVSGDAGAGDITLNAGGAVSIAGLVVAHASTSDGDGGCIMVTAGSTIGITGQLDASSGSQGAGGMICLEAVGAVSVSGVLDATGGDFDGGEVDVDSSQGSVTLGEIDVPGGGTSGSGGTVLITAQQDITLNGPLNGPGGGQTGQGGDGADITVIANGSTRVLAPVNAASGPDGSGGSPDIEGTNGDVVVSAAIKAAGIGTDSCGGDVFLSEAGNLSVQQIDASGGTCGGGDIQATAVNGTLSLPAELDADGAAADSGGSMELAGQVLQVGAAAKLHANSGFRSDRGERHAQPPGRARCRRRRSRQRRLDGARRPGAPGGRRREAPCQQRLRLDHADRLHAQCRCGGADLHHRRAVDQPLPGKRPHDHRRHGRLRRRQHPPVPRPGAPAGRDRLGHAAAAGERERRARAVSHPRRLRQRAPRARRAMRRRQQRRLRWLLAHLHPRALRQRRRRLRRTVRPRAAERRPGAELRCHVPCRHVKRAARAARTPDARRGLLPRVSDPRA